ncbi:MAG: Hsp20/alpha crystallin family protein [Candidatus Thermoplasmatota archaeon]|nr:Hsp20/alpha crystallin family protein [Candidatus Thermoplasmatota archaeon]MCL5790567.1 Hsp20/alpha crystallin family protein [Candidatus Thermoplasmatota archaeon]
MTTVYGPLRFMADEFMKNVNERAKEVLTFLYPPVKMYESGGDLVIEADMPGFEKKDIKVTANKYSIELSASRKEQEDANVYLDQRPSRLFKSIRLPVDIDLEQPVSAKYTNGVLVIKTPIKGIKTLKIE